VYQHEVVIHAQNFVDPNHPEVNTQAAEGFACRQSTNCVTKVEQAVHYFPVTWTLFSGVSVTRYTPSGQHLKLLSDLTVLVIELTVFL